MPILEKITVADFRNIRLQELEFSPNLNCISGNNGEGKTNLLDAIYYLSMTKSAFSSTDRYNFRYGTSSFSICGTYLMPNSLESRFSIQVDLTGEKKVRRDDKPYGKVSSHIGVLPVVMVSPEDISLISESGEERRRFVNSVLSQMDREYLASLQQYNRLLQQRNRMLKELQTDRDLLSVFDSRLQAYAEPVYEARKKFTDDIRPVISEYYRMLSGGSEQVDVCYRSDLEKGALADLLASSYEKDRILKYTSAGIQRDDFEFSMNGWPIRKCGSQGQQKSFLVSLKFAQYEIMKRCCGFAPLLLLDDVFDKLDMNRISNLLSMVSGSDFGQIFITDSNKVRMAGIVDRITEDRAYFEVSAGEFRLSGGLPEDEDLPEA
ncbi:MAG: DNA replication and repair protein RecF [Bacteroidetes bacterium]|uniref:DNA replication and repair protein RecF n=1 Tax=Candidatus Cryptobacteroides faecipullorum TaxID=2840764 RepID=A0A9D9I784_9BACT|nr:DNA replication and repair protein RecF [Candidatus Cryptobacteroides faecipullorum]